MENILYEIGLSLDSAKSDPNKRILLNNPIFIFINSVLYLLFSIISLLTNDINVILIIGDFGHILHFEAISPGLLWLSMRAFGLAPW